MLFQRGATTRALLIGEIEVQLMQNIFNLLGGVSERCSCNLDRRVPDRQTISGLGQKIPGWPLSASSVTLGSLPYLISSRTPFLVLPFAHYFTDSRLRNTPKRGNFGLLMTKKVIVQQSSISLNQGYSLPLSRYVWLILREVSGIFFLASRSGGNSFNRKTIPFEYLGNFRIFFRKSGLFGGGIFGNFSWSEWYFQYISPFLLLLGHVVKVWGGETFGADHYALLLIGKICKKRIWNLKKPFLQRKKLWFFFFFSFLVLFCSFSSKRDQFFAVFENFFFVRRGGGEG